MSRSVCYGSSLSLSSRVGQSNKTLHSLELHSHNRSFLWSRRPISHSVDENPHTARRMLVLGHCVSLLRKRDALNLSFVEVPSLVMIVKLNWHPRSIKCELLALALQLCNIRSVASSSVAGICRGETGWINAFRVECLTSK